MALAADMLYAAGIAASHRQALALAEDALNSGRAAETFGRMVRVLGGPADFIDDCRRYLPAAPVRVPVPSPHEGYRHRHRYRDIGVAVVALGGGRTRPQDDVDHAVGLTELAQLAQKSSRGDPLALRAGPIARDEAKAAVQLCRLPT